MDSVFPGPNLIGVRGMPERDILSLCVMGWRLEKFGTSSVAVVIVTAAHLELDSTNHDPKAKQRRDPTVLRHSCSSNRCYCMWPYQYYVLRIHRMYCGLR